MSYLLRKNKQKTSYSAGFTLVEMLAIAPVIVIMIGVFVGAIISMTGDTLVTKAGNQLSFEVQDALDTIERDVRYSGAFLSTTNVPTPSPTGFKTSTTDTSELTTFTNLGAGVTGSTGAALILNSLSTTGNPLSATRSLIYKNNSPYPCGGTAAEVSQNQVLTHNTVYFIRDNTLWKRTLMPSDFATRGCATPWQLPSCHPSRTETQCRTQDVRLVSGVTPADFQVTYYPSAQSTTANTNARTSTNAATRQSATSESASVLVRILAKQTVSGKEITHEGTLRATRVGPLITQAP